MIIYLFIYFILLQEYGIRGFPTIKVFSPGKPPVDYQGARDVKPIVEFALSQVCRIKCYLDGLYFSSICSLDAFQSLLVYTRP